MRVVVDTNVWVSALINPRGTPAAILGALMTGRFALVASLPMLAELHEVLMRPRLADRFGITHDTVDTLLALLHERADLTDVAGEVRLCRDPDDDTVIETALNGRADALVTRDDDLKGEADLVVHLRQRGVAVVTVRELLAML